MKVINLLGMCAIVVALISCGGSKKESDANTSDSAQEMLNDMSSTDFSSDNSGSSLLKEESDDSSTEESGDKEDWDAVLDSYEEYVDSYISLLKKANAGDLDALSEYPSLLQNAKEMGEKLSTASSDLSASQISRYNRINQKMLNAAQEMN